MNSSSIRNIAVLLLLTNLLSTGPTLAQTQSCCGPNLGPEAINWLQLPTNTTVLLPDPAGANPAGTWIIANLPGYGPVLVIQDTPTNIVAVCTNADFGRVHSGGSFENVPNLNGSFNFTESLPGPYGPYSWGIPPGSVALGYAHMYTGGGQGAPLPPYQVSFYFLNGQPDPCRLVWSTIGLAEHTTNSLSQPVTFRTEYDLVYDPTNYPLGPSAETVLDGIYGGPLSGGVSGTVVSSGFDLTGGDDFNTGWGVFQPTNSLLMNALPPGSGTDVNGNAYPPYGSAAPPYPYLTVTVNHQLGDIFSLTVGYLCCTNCPTNCLEVAYSSGKMVPCGSDWTFDPPAVSSCCAGFLPGTTTNVEVQVLDTVTNGVCPQFITRSWLVVDACGNSNSCSQIVTVVGCCQTNCCGPNLGPQTIQWLEFPAANSTALSPNPTGANGPGTWIVTNLPCYGRVLVTQTFPNPPNLTYWFQNPNFLNVQNAAGTFFDMQGGYGPYSWGNFSSILDFYNASSSTPINYTVNFYFLDGPPNPCSLVLGVVGLAEFTTATLSQPMTFRGEYSLYAGDVPGNGRASAYSTVDGSYPAAGITGTMVGSAYGVSGPGFGIGDWQNTGWALLQPTNNLAAVTLPPGSGAGWPGPLTGVPVLSLAVNQEGYDGIGFTVGYICCPQGGTNCLQVQCPSNKAVDCGVAWSFDQPLATTCCTSGSGTTGPSISITPTGTVTNGVCPQLTITQSWLITDACGNSATCSQTVTVVGCCQTNCLQVQCPPDQTIECGDVLAFGAPSATTCCTNNPPGTPSVNIVPLGTVTNGTCPQVTITENWLITDACGDSNLCSQTVTVLGCCSTNCLQVQCPPDKSVDCGSALSFDTPTATTCCNNNPAAPPVLNIVPIGMVTNGVCPQVTITENWLITDGCGDSNICSQTVTVLGCCPTNCCGPTSGARTIQWLEFPAAGSSPLANDPTGSNGPGTWIVTNLPCYGRVLVTQTFPSSPNLVYWFQNPNFLNVPNANGTFFDTQGGYNYNWGNYSSILDFYNASSSAPLSYTVNFYFLDGQPNPCSLVLGVAGLAETTTTTLSQPMTFRGEFDLYAGDVPGNGRASAYTTMGGSYPAAGLTGTVVGSAYGVAGAGYGVGDWQNTGWSLLQPTNNLATVTLPPGSGPGWPGPLAGVPVLSLAVNQEGYDGIGFTVGYICCPPGTNCLSVQCPSDKAVDCGVAWSFDLPTATSCCTNGSGATGANVTITPSSTVTNGTCPQVTIIQTWLITDACGNSATCSQTVFVLGCCQTNCLQVQCSADKTIECGDGLSFNRPTATTCCTNGSGTTGGATITPIGTVTNGACPQMSITRTWLITDGCGDSNLCSQTVTVLGCCSTNCLQVQCPPAKTVQCGSAWSFDAPTATTCCPTNFVTTAGTLTNVLITPIGFSTSGICPQVITATWVISDACGDSTNCSQAVTVIDTTPPMVSCLTNVQIVPLDPNCDLVIPPIKFIARDNCTPTSQLIFHQSPPAGTIETNHSQVVTVTVTDLCGNSNQCSVLVLGVDEIGPAVLAPASVSVTNCLVPCVTGLVSVRDNCCPANSLSITQWPACNTPLGPGINSVRVTVTDCNGNTTTVIIHLVVSGPESFLGILYNTGMNASHALLSDAAVDPHYALPGTAVPPGMPSDYRSNAVAVSTACYSIPSGCGYFRSPGCYIYVPWSLASPFSKWIGPDLTNNGCCPRGNYQYAYTFTLPANLNPATATISGRWAADNQALLYVNANPLPVAFTPTFALWTPFTIPAGSGFVSGVNTLTFNVANADSWTGLRVEFTNAFANCSTCAPPAIIWITPAQSLPLGGAATFNVNAGGSPPLSYQWYHNNVPLVNNAHVSGVTTPSLHVAPLNFGDAGLYSVLISNPCGVTTGYVRLNVTKPWAWQWGWWNVAQVANPLAATVGPDLNLVGSNGGTNFGLFTGTSDDFGLPAPGAQAANVMGVLLPTDTSLQVPLIAPPGSNAVTSYTVVMDLYEPDTSMGVPSTLFQSYVCCLGSSGQDGVGLTLDAQNNLHLVGSAAGVRFDVSSTAPLPADSWNRLALVVDDPQDGIEVNLSLYLNGQSVASLSVPTSTGLPINWSNSPPTLLSRQTIDTSANPELYAANLQFHDIALDPQLLAGLGSTGSGPVIPDQGLVGTTPVLSATLANGSVTLSWTGSGYALQETTDLRSGAWMDSELPFIEGQTGGGDPQTSAAATPSPEAPRKFYRLVFRP